MEFHIHLALRKSTTYKHVKRVRRLIIIDGLK